MTSAFRDLSSKDRRSAAAADVDVDDDDDGEWDERDDDDYSTEDRVSTVADGQNYEDTEEKKVLLYFF